MNSATAAESGVVLVLIGIALLRFGRGGVRGSIVDRAKACGA
jgi:hypothetical protein